MKAVEHYICLNCEELFDTPCEISDPGTGERYWRSPCCLDGFMPVVSCERCGKLIAVGADTHGLCGHCAEATVARLRYFLNNEFTEEEREVLNEAFDGVPLTEPEKAKVVVP